MKQPMSSSLVMPESEKYESLDNIIREENHVPITEPAVVSSDEPAKETATTKVEEQLPASEESKYTPLSDVVKSETTDTEQEAEDSKKEDKPNSSESAVVETPKEAPTTDNSDPYSFLVDGGLLNTPEGFEFDGTEESFNKLVEYDQQVRDYQSMQRIEQGIQDPKVFELIQHGLEGGRFADMGKMFEVSQGSLDIEAIDPSNDSEAEKVLARYYKEVAKFSNEQSARYIEAAKDQDTLEGDAKHAIEHFKGHYEKEKVKLTEEAKAQKAEAAQVMKHRIQGVAETIKTNGYKGDVVKGISTLLSPVHDENNRQVFKEDNSPMLWYEVQVERIAENPQHLTEFLALLQSYDDNKGFSQVKGRSDAKESTKKNKAAFDAFMKLKGKQKAGSIGEGNNAPYVPPAPDSYDI